MTLSEEQLSRIIRTAIKSAIDEAVGKARTPNLLSGTVEQIDAEDLDVVYIRMDDELLGGDPTQSMNYEYPGVIPATRLGETFTDEEVRVEFNGPAGASAMRTSAQTRIILPFGSESGQRVQIEGGDPGYIAFYDENGDLVGYLDGSIWEIGDLATPGARVTMDPIGGLRLRSDSDALVSVMNQQGYSLREAESGLVTAEITHGSFRMVDPSGTADIEFVTSSDGTLPNPAYRAATEASPGGSLTIPVAPTFTSTPADDIEIGHVAAWLSLVIQSATMTPPSGWTERIDSIYNGGDSSLHTSVATRQPATGTTGDFTSTQTNWAHAVGTHVVIKGGGASSPAYRSSTTADAATLGNVATVSINKPSGVADGDALVTFVAMGVRGGFLPTGWTVPDGFVFLGANYITTGTGSAQSTIAVGCWVKRAGASEPSSYSTTINFPPGVKALSASMVAIEDAYLVPGGVQIRLNGHPARQLLAMNELQADSATLCDFQNIPQSYDNLELLYDSIADQNGGTVNIRTRMRYNADTGNNYFYQLFEVESSSATIDTAAHALLTDRILLTGLSAADDAASSGQLNILGYSNATSRKVLLGQGYWASDAGLNLRNGKYTGQWNGTSINRITIEADTTPNRFKAGSRAYLYGY